MSTWSSRCRTTANQAPACPLRRLLSNPRGGARDLLSDPSHWLGCKAQATPMPNCSTQPHCAATWCRRARSTPFWPSTAGCCSPTRCFADLFPSGRGRPSVACRRGRRGDGAPGARRAVGPRRRAAGAHEHRLEGRRRLELADEGFQQQSLNASAACIASTARAPAWPPASAPVPCGGDGAPAARVWHPPLSTPGT